MNSPLHYTQGHQASISSRGVRFGKPTIPSVRRIRAFESNGWPSLSIAGRAGVVDVVA